MKRVVVIGGGFAGTAVAKKLNGKCDLTLIDTEDYFEYTPGILRVLVEPEHYKKLHAKHKDYLPKTKIIVGHVKKIEDKKVALMDGKKINYDYLVIASGSNYNTPIKEEDTFFATRVKHLLDANKKIQNSKKILIVGGGLVGIELAAELVTHYNDKKIQIINAGPNILERNNIKTRQYAQKFLEKKGVEIINNEKIVDKSKNKVIGESGKVYDYDMVFFTVGIKPNTTFMQGDFSKFVPRGIEVNEYLQIPGMENIFVAGDVSNIVEEKTAQNAELHGKIVANNILATLKGKKMKRYTSKRRLMVISLGKYKGIVEKDGFVMTGLAPALMKATIEKMVMFTFR